MAKNQNQAKDTDQNQAEIPAEAPVDNQVSNVAEALTKAMEVTKTGGSKVSASSAKVLTLLRDPNNAAGLTAKEIQEKLGLRNVKEARKRIREAIAAGADSGDMVFTTTGGETRATKTYGVIAKNSAAQLDKELVKTFAEKATDFSWNGETKGRFAKDDTEN